MVRCEGRAPAVPKLFILGYFPETAHRRLPKVKLRGHVYPLSYLPYF